MLTEVVVTSMSNDDIEALDVIMKNYPRIYIIRKINTFIYNFINLFYYNIRTSLYEQFHSDINKQHMFKLIETYLQKEKNIDISNNKRK